MTTLKCLDCNMVEREEHVMQGKHVCGRVTDPLWKPQEDVVLKIGKKIFVKILV